MEEGSSGGDLWQKSSDKHSKFKIDEHLQNTLHLYSVGSSDPGYKLPLYLSQYALDDFNMRSRERYEKVNVVETLFRMNSVNTTTTYLITFEASLPTDDTVQTFITKISMSLPDPHHPTTKIDFIFVKIKGEEFDYEAAAEDDLSDSGSPKLFVDIDSESDDEQHSKETLLDCNKKDFQAHLDGFDKEKSPNFCNIVSEENLKESHEEHFEDKSSEFQKKDSQKTLQGIDEKHSKEKSPEFHKKDSEGNLSEFHEEVAKKGVHYRPSPTPFPVQKKKKVVGQVGPKLRAEMKSFNNDLARSDGFEVGYYPHMERARIHGTWMFKYYDIENKTVSATNMNHLVCLAQLAICVYNMKEDTYFDNVKVLKAMTSGCGGVTYNMTFEASLRGSNAEIFQTRLFTALPLPYAKIEILFVRIKPSCNFIF